MDSKWSLTKRKRVTRFERATSTLARLRSTTELYPRNSAIINMPENNPGCQAFLIVDFGSSPTMKSLTIRVSGLPNQQLAWILFD